MGHHCPRDRPDEQAVLEKLTAVPAQPLERPVYSDGAAVPSVSRRQTGTVFVIGETALTERSRAGRRQGSRLRTPSQCRPAQRFASPDPVCLYCSGVQTEAHHVLGKTMKSKMKRRKKKPPTGFPNRDSIDTGVRAPSRPVRNSSFPHRPLSDLATGPRSCKDLEQRVPG